MGTIARKTTTVCAIILAFCATLYFLFISKTIILYLLIAIMLAISINPLVKRIEKFKIKKSTAIIISDLFLLIILFSILGTIITPLIFQGISLFENFPQIAHNILNNPTLLNLSYKYHFDASLNQLSSQVSGILFTGGNSIFTITNNLIQNITSTTVVLVLTFLLQIEGEKIWENLISFLREKDSKTAQRVGGRISKAIGGFVSGNLFISLIAGTVTLVLLLILRVPYAFALAGLVALFDLIPLVGAAIATIAVGLVALTKGILIAVIAVVVILIYQFIEGHFIQPIVYSKSVNLSALIIVLASVLGAEIGGIIGILLAIPVASVVQIIITETYSFLHTT